VKRKRKKKRGDFSRMSQCISILAIFERNTLSPSQGKKTEEGQDLEGSNIRIQRRASLFVKQAKKGEKRLKGRRAENCCNFLYALRKGEGKKKL